LLHRTATPTLYTLSLHDALPILPRCRLEPVRRRRPHLGVRIHVGVAVQLDIGQALRTQGLDAPVLGLVVVDRPRREPGAIAIRQDRKSTRLNSSHRTTSYAVFCL